MPFSPKAPRFNVQCTSSTSVRPFFPLTPPLPPRPPPSSSYEYVGELRWPSPRSTRVHRIRPSRLDGPARVAQEIPDSLTTDGLVQTESPVLQALCRGSLYLEILDGCTRVRSSGCGAVNVSFLASTIVSLGVFVSRVPAFLALRSHPEGTLIA